MFAIFMIAAGCHIINEKVGVTDDHPAEEVAERLLENYLEIPEGSIDFTPGD